MNNKKKINIDNKNISELINELKKKNIYLESEKRVVSAINNELKADKEILRKQRIKLEEANKKLKVHIENQDILLKNLIHEMKNKFNEIYAQFNFISKNLDKNNVVKAIAQTNIIQQDFENLLEWTKKYSLELKPQITNFRFNLIIENIRKIYSVFQGDLKIIKNYNVSATIKTDEQLLQIIFHNLIKNSLNSRNKGLIIKINFVQEQKYYSFELIDNGKGFRKSFLENQDVTLKAGLGLILVKKFVETLGGSIKFDNLPEGGAKVSFKIKNYEYLEI